jgi:hypothetical protein
MKAMEEGTGLLDRALSGGSLEGLLSEAELREICSLERHLRHEELILSRLSGA